jgi:hypothetical protein
MATQYDYRLLVVVRAAKRDAAETAAHVVDPDAGVIFSSRLRVAGDETNTITAYQCSWLMKKADGTRLLSALKANGFANKDIQIVPLGSAPDMTNDMWVFDEGAGWTPVMVREALGFAEMKPWWQT